MRHLAIALTVFAGVQQGYARLSIAAEISLASILADLEDISARYATYHLSQSSLSLTGDGIIALRYSRRRDQLGPVASDVKAMAFVVEDTVNISFASDIKGRRLYCEYLTQESVCRTQEGERIKVSSRPLRFRSIVRDDGYWSADDFEQTRLSDEARNSGGPLVAERFEMEAALSDAKYGRVVDPRGWYGEHPDDAFGRWIERLISLCKRFSAETEVPIYLTRSRLESGDPIISIEVLMDRQGDYQFVSKYIVRDDAYCVPLSFTRTVLPDTDVINSVEWNYREVDGLPLPILVRRVDRGLGEESGKFIEQVVRLETLTVSSDALSDSVFDLSRLGVGVNTKVYDRAIERVQRFDGNKLSNVPLVPVPDPNMSRRSSQSIHERSTGRFYLLVTLNAVVVAMVCLFVWGASKRKSSRGSERRSRAAPRLDE